MIEHNPDVILKDIRGILEVSEEWAWINRGRLNKGMLR